MGPPRSPGIDVDQMTLYRQRDRVKELEQKLKSIQGISDVWKSKAGKAAEWEHFILDEVRRASEKMLGEQPPSPRAFSFALFLF